MADALTRFMILDTDVHADAEGHAYVRVAHQEYTAAGKGVPERVLLAAQTRVKILLPDTAGAVTEAVNAVLDLEGVDGEPTQREQLVEELTKLQNNRAARAAAKEPKKVSLQHGHRCL